jgi:hypothetical protein
VVVHEAGFPCSRIYTLIYLCLPTSSFLPTPLPRVVVANYRGNNEWLFGEAVNWLKYVCVLKRSSSHEVRACERVGDADVTEDAGVNYAVRGASGL